jgi:hypothetical protein
VGARICGGTRSEVTLSNYVCLRDARGDLGQKLGITSPIKGQLELQHGVKV